MPNETFFVRARGRVTGPFDLSTLGKLVQRGTISRIDQVSSDRTSWTPAGDFEELFPARSVQRAAAQVAQAATTKSWGESADPADQDVVPFQADDADITPLQFPSAAPVAPAGQQCTRCRGFFEPDDLYNDGGQIICKRCHSAAPESAPRYGYPAPAAYAVPTYAPPSAHARSSFKPRRPVPRKSRGPLIAILSLIALCVAGAIIYTVYATRPASSRIRGYWHNTSIGNIHRTLSISGDTIRVYDDNRTIELRYKIASEKRNLSGNRFLELTIEGMHADPAEIIYSPSDDTIATAIFISQPEGGGIYDWIAIAGTWARGSR